MHLERKPVCPPVGCMAEFTAGGPKCNTHPVNTAHIDGIPVGVLAHRNGIITYVNEALCTLVDRRRDELLGAHFSALFTPEEAQRLTESAERRARGEPVPESWRSVTVRRPDGTERAVEVDVSCVGGEFLCAVRDVTEAAARSKRRQALAHLGVSLQSCREEHQLAETVHHSIKAVDLSDVWLEPDGDNRVRVTRIDPTTDEAFERTLGRSLVGSSAPWIPWLRRVWTEGEAYTDDALDEVERLFEAPFAHAARSIAASLHLTRALGVRIDAGSAPHAILVLWGGWLHPDDLAFARLLRGHLSAALDTTRYLDGTRRRMSDLVAVNEFARRALMEAQRSPQAVLEAAAACAHERLRAQASVLRVVDGTLHGTVGAYADLEAPIERTPLVALALASSEPIVVDDLARDPRTLPGSRAKGFKGSVLLVKVSTRRGPWGLLTAHDPTARRFTEEEVALASTIASVAGVALENAELHAESRAHLTELRETQARLVERERLAALGEVAAVVAHEVRNPLAVIFNAVGTLRRRIAPAPEVNSLLDIVREEAGRLNQIVSDLLDFARPSTPQRRAETLGPIVESAVEAALARAHTHHPADKLVVKIDVGAEVPQVWVDARMVRQALLNLCLNAIEAMPKGGTLTVALHDVPERRCVAIDVCDTGPGVSAEARARIFMPFYTTRSAGTGLGLAVVKRVAEAHGGSVAVRDAAGGGAVFTLELPTTPPDDTGMT